MAGSIETQCMLINETFFGDINETFAFNQTLDFNQTLAGAINETAGGSVFSWGPGTLPFELPPDMGFPLGGKTGFRSFFMDIHYDNPELLDDIVDDTGVRIYYTKESRPIEVDVFATGDNMWEMNRVGEGVREYTFVCSGGCSAASVPASGVTVIRTALHMHRTGIQASNEVIRNGTVVSKATVDFFDFSQQGDQVVQAEPFKIFPGDTLRTNCTYRNPPNSTTSFGPASYDEMCIAFLLYYPRLQAKDNQLAWACGIDTVDGCGIANFSRTLADERELGRTFGQTDSFNNSIQCPLATPPSPGDSSPSDNGTSADASSASSSAMALRASIVLACVVAALL
jgi:Copper type II ascorbate-dependent monooxygenase, C-terminal domain/Copper type II ascorbate-dependent monooxygenase, N-terminal domain